MWESEAGERDGEGEEGWERSGMGSQCPSHSASSQTCPREEGRAMSDGGEGETLKERR